MAPASIADAAFRPAWVTDYIAVLIRIAPGGRGLEKQLRHLDFVEQAARHQLPQRETGLIEHGIAMARFGPMDIGDFIAENGRAVFA